MVSNTKKLELIKSFGKNEKDSGSIEAQIAILTEDIESLKLHFEKNKKDLHSRRGFIAKINHRKKLLAYLRKNKFTSYASLIEKLNIRK
ncbi:30S ribosomal protein S15 [[Mycoplasma] mobile]|uniref:Small ribosomal subunit protein uS15 n=1 Tax=Mycoplasma mobile (strain ATCC 43663 / 163K / NCTC 11711) TaxID=267748 RepID=RS15_MYCM1|nr:30S ribosomal protein S15 [[Mycoplasma] mobile]Q6KHH5.1 RecName: Full=Small ribosomal subunit protein uS15; AltName: Full=30S ribosomal protein S15 [Mycoplasma mobile 163K]AAT27955.1 30S ribosomal protein s15 [Mycoplasma mobile 163K]